MKRGYWFYISVISAALLYIILLTLGGQTPQTEQLKDKRIIVVLKSVEHPMDFWDVVKTGMQEAGRESGVQLEFTGPPHEQMVELQIEMFYQAVEENPDLIVLAAGDYDLLKQPVEYAHEQGIPVLTMDSAVDSDIPVSFVATDNLEAGVKAGEKMAEIIEARGLGRDAGIMIMSHSKGTATAIEREKGVRKGLEGYNIIGTWYCDIEYEIAYNLTVELLESEPIDAIVGLNEVSALGVADAVYDLGLGGEIPVVGFDNAARQMASLEAGVLEATVVQRPYNMGYMSIKQAERYLLGKSVEPEVNTGSILITRENMFQPEYQEVLFPFEKLEQ